MMKLVSYFIDGLDSSQKMLTKTNLWSVSRLYSNSMLRIPLVLLKQAELQFKLSLPEVYEALFDKIMQSRDIWLHTLLTVTSNLEAESEDSDWYLRSIRIAKRVCYDATRITGKPAAVNIIKNSFKELRQNN